MTKVLVHGNPETDAIWGPLIDALAALGVDDVVTLSPPGFGAPVPEGFDATPAGYVGWFAEQIAPLAAQGPVDIVGHDWGAGHVFGLAAERPELIRSWSADIAGLLNPSYEWHDAAKSWQTEGEGEEAVAFMAALSADELGAVYADLGLPADIAHSMGAAFDKEMARCILSLYRAAKEQVLQDLANRLASAEQRPSLLLNATADAYVDAALVPAVAERMGSTVLELTGLGHWWMVDPGGATVAAAGLAAFWNGLD